MPRSNNLTPEQKRARLKQLLEERAAKPKVAAASFAQERLWVLQQLAPARNDYAECGAFRIQAAVDLPAVEDALQQVVKRHEILRTVFGKTESGVVQEIQPHQRSTRLEIIDLRELPSERRDAEGCSRWWSWPCWRWPRSQRPCSRWRAR